MVMINIFLLLWD